MRPPTLAATALPSTTLWGSTRDFAFSVVRDRDGTAWCGLCLAESCKHTALVASAIADGTAPAPVRRKASGGRRAGAGRPAQHSAGIQKRG